MSASHPLALLLILGTVVLIGLGLRWYFLPEEDDDDFL